MPRDHQGDAREKNLFFFFSSLSPVFSVAKKAKQNVLLLQIKNQIRQVFFLQIIKEWKVRRRLLLLLLFAR